MPQASTTLETETKLKSIEQNNNLFERKCSNFDRQRDEISRSMANLQTCNSHVKRMVFITKDKLLNVKANIEKHHKNTQKFVQNSNSSLDSSFEKVDLIRDNNYHSLHHGHPSLSITLPYESSIQAATQEKERLRLSIQELANADEKLKNEKDSIDKLQHSTAKAKSKVEKEIAQLRNDFEQHTNIITALQSSSSVIGKQLSAAKESVAVITDEKMKISLEVKEAEKIRDDLLKQLEASKPENGDILATFDELYSDTNSGEDFDLSLLENLPDCEEISELLAELKQLESEASGLSQPAEYPSSEALSTLEASLESTKKETKRVAKEVEQIKDYNKRHADNVETLAEKRFGIESVKQQIAENTTILGSLEVAKHAAKPVRSGSLDLRKEEAFRQLKATRNDVPGPEPYEPYQTPTRGASTKRTPNGSGRVGNSPMLSYPGIDTLQKNGIAAPTRETSEQNDSSSSLDTSLSDDGTTQDESQMNLIFTPPPNNKSETPPFEPFSMKEHFNEFSQRQARKEASKISSRNEKDEEDDISMVDSDGEDEEEIEEIDDDDDDDLMAPDDEDADQSVWGLDE